MFDNDAQWKFYKAHLTPTMRMFLASQVYRLRWSPDDILEVGEPFGFAPV
jgi:hypothetical protein